MTHPIYSQATLTALTVADLKTIAHQLGAIPDGDCRKKATWVAAILDHQIKFSPARVEAMEAHIAEVMDRATSLADRPEIRQESICHQIEPELPQPAPQPILPQPQSHLSSHQASLQPSLPSQNHLPQPSPQPPLKSLKPQPPTLTQPTLKPQQQHTAQYYRGASIVLIAPIMLLIVAIGALVSIIGSLIRFTGSLIKRTGNDTDNKSIDCPLVVAA